MPRDAKRELMEPSHPQLRLARPCDLVGWPRSTDDDAVHGERTAPRAVRHVLEKPYTDTPYAGGRRMTAWWRRQGEAVQHNRVARRLHTLG